MLKQARDIGWTTIRSFIVRFERPLGIAALLFGFIFDSLTLTRIDFIYENVVIVGYLILAMATIVVAALKVRDRLRNIYVLRFAAFGPLILQFTFGGLFSAFLVFFARSASFSASWPFLLILAGILFGNEFFRERYSRFSFQILIWFLALYLYLTLVLPVIIGSIGFAVFLLSGVLALFIVLAVIRLLEYLVPVLMAQLAQTPLRLMVGLLVVMNVLYVLNIIPPIPLSLKEAGAYEYVERQSNGEYIKERTDQPWYIDWFSRDRIELPEGASAYFFSSVFSPTNLDTKIVHHWQRYSQEENEWRSVAYVPYTIHGGRDEGYRGFTLLSRVMPGTWRVRVETERGQLLGRETFVVTEPTEPSECMRGWLPGWVCFWHR